MCISLKPSKMSKTKIMVGRCSKEEHYLAYKNTSVNLSDKPNVMVLPIPTDYLDASNVIDTSSYKEFLNVYEEAIKPVTLNGGSLRLTRSRGVYVNQISSGSYDIVVGNSLEDIFDVISGIPIGKKPDIQISDLMKLKDIYPNYSFAFCIWDGQVDAEPIMFKYKPFDYDRIFIPTLDLHDGKDFSFGSVFLDHSIIIGLDFMDDIKEESSIHGSGNLLVANFGSKDLTYYKRSIYHKADISDKMKEILPTKICGTKLIKYMPNGDIYFNCNDKENRLTREMPDVLYEQYLRSELKAKLLPRVFSAL